MASRLLTYAALAGFLGLAVPLGETRAAHRANNAHTSASQYAMPEVDAGRLEYTKKCGWVDWDHSMPDGAKRLLDIIMLEAGVLSADGKHYELEYRQDMKKYVGSVRAVALVNGKFKIKRGLSKEEKIRVAYAIFDDISHRFEEFQGEPPCSIASEHSSFAEEDLPSNLIGFDRAAYGLSRRNIERLCQPIGKKQSLRMLDRGEYGEKKYFQ